MEFIILMETQHEVATYRKEKTPTVHGEKVSMCYVNILHPCATCVY